MAQFSKNTIGIYPKIKSLAEEITIDLIERYKIRVNKTPETIVKIYYNDILIDTTTDSEITLPTDFIDFNKSRELTLECYKTIFNYTQVLKKTTIILAQLTCCSDTDEIVYTCSDKLVCV